MSGESDKIQKTPKRGKKKHSQPSLSDGEEPNNIKSRLRNNSGTPQKLFKDSVSNTNALQLKRRYAIEGKSMELFLGKSNSVASELNNRLPSSKDPQGENATDGSESETDTEVSLRQSSINKDVSATAVSTQIREGVIAIEHQNRSNPLKRLQTDTGAHTTKMGVQQDTQGEQVRVAEKELSSLENKFKQLEDGSMEKMLMEMRIDIKRDNVAMMKKIDNVSRNTDNLSSQVESIQVTQRDLDQRLQFTQGKVDADNIRINKIASEVNSVQEQMRVLQGIVSTQEQRHLLANL